MWETSSARLLGAADGTLFAALAPDATLDADATALPRVSDERAMARLMRAGDRIPEALLRTALRLASLDPAALGSNAERLGVRIDDEFGLGLVAAEPGWEMAFGVYGTDPDETAARRCRAPRATGDGGANALREPRRGRDRVGGCPQPREGIFPCQGVT